MIHVYTNSENSGNAGGGSFFMFKGRKKACANAANDLLLVY